MNHMMEVAKILGVELDEEFGISTFGSLKFKLTQYDLKTFCESTGKWVTSSFICDILSGRYDIVKIPILDEVEKRYLSNIIKPWRKCVNRIFKYGSEDYEYIVIKYYSEIFEKECYILLPAFEKGKMYKGMKFGNEYMLNELGL